METQHQSGFITGSPVPTSDEKNWGMLAHLSALFAGFFGVPFVGPLLVLLIKGKESAWVEAHAKEALNFQLMVTGVLWLSLLSIICLVGVFLAPLVGLGALIFSVIASMKAYNGEVYRYPFNNRLVK